MYTIGLQSQTEGNIPPTLFWLSKNRLKNASHVPCPPFPLFPSACFPFSPLLVPPSPLLLSPFTRFGSFCSDNRQYPCLYRYMIIKILHPNCVPLTNTYVTASKLIPGHKTSTIYKSAINAPGISWIFFFLGSDATVFFVVLIVIQTQMYIPQITIVFLPLYLCLLCNKIMFQILVHVVPHVKFFGELQMNQHKYSL